MNLRNSPPLVGGDRGEGDSSINMSPLPQPSPVKGEGQELRQ